jgi:hypothetical protein
VARAPPPACSFLKGGVEGPCVGSAPGAPLKRLLLEWVIAISAPSERVRVPHICPHPSTGGVITFPARANVG